MLMSVLPIWGQTDKAFEYKNLEDNSTLEEIKQMTDQCNQFTSDVIDSAVKQKAITEEKKDDIQRLLTSTFSSLKDLLKKMESIEDNDYKASVKKEIIGFLNNYQSAILNTNHSKIRVSSTNFHKVTQEVNAKIKDSLKKIDQEANNADSVDGTGGENNTVESENSSQETATQDQKDYDNPWTLISLILGSCGVVCAVGAFVYTIKIKEDLNNEIKNCKYELQLLKSKNTLVSKPPIVRVTPPPVTTTSGGTKPDSHTRKKTQKNRTNQPQSGQDHPTTPQGKTPDPTEKTILYAKVKGDGPFIKISTTKSNDSVFELILAKPNSSVAELTLVPLNQEFKKEVIRNKATYLPSTFCEIIYQSGTPTDIEVINPGKAIYENGNWKLEERMQICL